jgi:hypothetical protein
MLADGPRTSSQLDRQTRTHHRSLHRLLRAVAGLGVVAQVEPERFELTELGTPLRADDRATVRNLVMTLCGPEAMRAWAELIPGVRTGEIGWERAHAMRWLEYYERNPEQSAAFNGAMGNTHATAAAGIVASTDFSRFRTVVDLGGGDGTLIAALLRAQPQLDRIRCDPARTHVGGGHARRGGRRGSLPPHPRRLPRVGASRGRRVPCSSRSFTTGTTSPPPQSSATAGKRWPRTDGS